MPELPDLQVFAHNLNKLLHGKTVKEVRSDGKGERSEEGDDKLIKTLKGQSVKNVYREGKELHFGFSEKDVLSIHLMLHGKIYLFEGSNKHKFTVLEFQFDDGTGMTVTDFQGRANATLNPEEKTDPDALSEQMNASFLREKLQKKRSTIKNLLLDQHVIRGIGNAYADEILWDARIAPTSVCDKIPVERIKDLAKSIKKVLKNGEKQILKTHPDIINGEVRDFLLIHNPQRKFSPTGAAIHVLPGGRKSYYTDEQDVFK